MADTIELIIRHTQELDEYMNKNGKYSFHRFSDGSIRYNASLFNDISRIEDTCLVPIEPVEELEELKKATVVKDTLVTINGFVEFAGEDAILGETSIEFYGINAKIKYRCIHKIDVIYNYELKALVHKIIEGYFGEVVNVNGIGVEVCDIEVCNDGITFPVRGANMEKHLTYDDIFIITDYDSRYIYRR